MYKKLLAAGLGICLAAASLTGCGSSATGNKAVATVGDTKIEYNLVNFMLRYNQAEMQSIYGAYLGTDYWTNYGSESRSSILQNLENMVILEQHMDDYNVSITDEEKTQISEAAAAFIAANDEATLKEMGADQETAERILTLYTIQRKMYLAIIAGVDTNVTDDEAAQKKVQYAFFSTADTTDSDGNKVERTDEEKAEIKAQAQQVLDAVKAGTDMDEALKEVDEDKKSTTSTYGSDNGTLSDALKEAADKLTEDGQVSDELVEIDSGYYVLKLVSLFDRDATDARKEEIISDRKSALYSDTTQEWLDAVDVTTDDKLLAKLTFVDTWQLKETETESETGTESTSDTESTSETGSEAESESASETAAETESESASETAAETESESASETASETETESASETETTSETETASETETK